MKTLSCEGKGVEQNSLSNSMDSRDVDARDEFSDLLIESGIHVKLKSSIPVDIDEIARFLGAQSIQKVNMLAAGMLRPNGNSFDIFVNKGLDPTRQRFSCAHELAHALFDSKYSQAWRSLNRPSGGELEKKCEALAAQILMPDPVFRIMANEGTASIQKVVELAKRFQTSIQATSLRLVDVLREECVLIISEMRMKPADTKLRVKWSKHNCVNSAGKSRFFIPQNASLNLHSADIAYRTGEIQSEIAEINIGNLRLEAHTESKVFGRTETTRYMMTLVFPE